MTPDTQQDIAEVDRCRVIQSHDLQQFVCFVFDIYYPVETRALLGSLATPVDPVDPVVVVGGGGGHDDTEPRDSTLNLNSTDDLYKRFSLCAHLFRENSSKIPMFVTLCFLLSCTRSFHEELSMSLRSSTL